MRPDQERVRNLLLDTVTLLCKNGLDYKKEMKVQGLIGITLDDEDVFLVHFDELSEIPSTSQDDESENETKAATKRPGDVIDIDLSPAKRHHSGAGTSTPRRFDLSNTLRQQVPETKPRVKDEPGEEVVILDDGVDEKPCLPIEGNIEMDSTQLAALTGFRDGGVGSLAGAPPLPPMTTAGSTWSPGRGPPPPGLPPGASPDMMMRSGRSQHFAAKTHRCSEEGCHRAFVHSRTLRDHERLVHGRKPKFRRSNMYNTNDLYRTMGGDYTGVHVFPDAGVDMADQEAAADTESPPEQSNTDPTQPVS